MRCGAFITDNFDLRHIEQVHVVLLVCPLLRRIIHYKFLGAEKFTNPDCVFAGFFHGLMPLHPAQGRASIFHPETTPIIKMHPRGCKGARRAPLQARPSTMPCSGLAILSPILTPTCPQTRPSTPPGAAARRVPARPPLLSPPPAPPTAAARPRLRCDAVRKEGEQELENF